MAKGPEDCHLADCCWDISGKVPKKIEGDPTSLILLIILPMLIGIILCISLNKLFKILEDKGLAYARAKQLFSQSGTIIVWFGCTSWGVQKYTNPCSDVGLWFNGELGVTPQTVIIGMMANVVFGFIDNAGLFFGGCYLDEVFALLPGSDDANVAAGYGNTFSDLLGAFMGTFVGIILQDATGISEGPLWANAVGIVVGCLLGIAIPKLLLGNSQNQGLNKISARQVLLGSMESDELEALIQNKMTLFDFRAMQTFKKLDFDGSGSLDIDEIRNYMIEAMGDDFNEEQFQLDLKEVFQIHKDGNDQEVDFSEFKDIYKNMAIEALKARKKDAGEKELLERKKSIRDDENSQANNMVHQEGSQKPPSTNVQTQNPDAIGDDIEINNQPNNVKQLESTNIQVLGQ